MPARRRRGIREAAGRGDFPAGLETGARPPYPCMGGRRHAWRPAEKPRLQAVAAARAGVLVRDWKECGRCGLVRVESTVPYTGMPDTVWFPGAEWSEWTEEALAHSFMRAGGRGAAAVRERG